MSSFSRRKSTSVEQIFGIFPIQSNPIQFPWNLVTSRVTPLPTTIMAEAQRAAYSLSISDLVCVLNEKLGLESSKFQGISLPLTCFASSLESEVSVPWQINPGRELTKANSIDRQPGSRSARYSETHSILAEHCAASQQVATRDPLLYRPVSDRER